LHDVRRTGCRRVGGWGHAGQGGICMPAKGRLVERAHSEAELAGLREGMAALGLNYEQLMACLGGTCVDVYLNERAYWRCVPLRVWSYTIGGYQVMKKWLSYRERPLLGRDLTADEARYVTEMARRIAALLLLEPALDENYARVKTDTYEDRHRCASRVTCVCSIGRENLTTMQRHPGKHHRQRLQSYRE
jgi:hypothetical protein